MPKRLSFLAGILFALCTMCLAFSWPSDPPKPTSTAESRLYGAAATVSEFTPTATPGTLPTWDLETSPGKQAVLYDPAKDTITNAEKDTLLLPYTLLSRFTYLFSVERTQLSGTANVKVYLDESNAQTGNTTWRTIDSTATTTATLAFFDGDEVYGRRLRLRISGTGTQSSTYKLRGTLKYK